MLDLVAEDVPPLTTAETFQVGGLPIAVDAPHEILVDKLCALLGRAELRDLVDVRELLAHGGDLTRALADAPRKDRGFSAVTLAWVLSGLDLRAMARMEELAADETRRLEASRDELVDRLTRSSMP